MARIYLLIAGLMVAASGYAAVGYTVKEAEFSSGEKRMLMITANGPEAVILALICQPSKKLEVQFSSKETIFPDTANRGKMHVRVTHRFDKEEPVQSAWLMNTMRYNDAWYEGDLWDFAEGLQHSGKLGMRFDKSGDVYRYALRGTSVHVAKILEACPRP